MPLAEIGGKLVMKDGKLCQTCCGSLAGYPCGCCAQCIAGVNISASGFTDQAGAPGTLAGIFDCDCSGLNGDFFVPAAIPPASRTPHPIDGTSYGGCSTDSGLWPGQPTPASCNSFGFTSCFGCKYFSYNTEEEHLVSCDNTEFPPGTFVSYGGAVWSYQLGCCTKPSGEKVIYIRVYGLNVDAVGYYKEVHTGSTDNPDCTLLNGAVPAVFDGTGAGNRRCTPWPPPDINVTIVPGSCP